MITGGNRGIGLNITESFVKAGYYVVIGARNDYGHLKNLEIKLFLNLLMSEMNNHIGS